MKPLLFIYTAVICMLSSRCKKDPPRQSVTSDVYTGVVIENACGQVVIKTLGPNYLGENGWISENDPSNTVHDHVFKVGNYCQFGNYPKGDTIKFRIINQQAQNCAVCLMYVDTPDTSYPIEVFH